MERVVNGECGECGEWDEILIFILECIPFLDQRWHQHLDVVLRGRASSNIAEHVFPGLQVGIDNHKLCAVQKHAPTHTHTQAKLLRYKLPHTGTCNSLSFIN